MHIAVFHRPDAHTTGNYFRKALAEAHTVSFLSEDFALGKRAHNSFDLVKYVAQQAVDLVLCIDPICGFFPLGLESIPCPTAIYLIDVHRGLSERLKLAQFFDAVCVAQHDFVVIVKDQGIENAFWLPLACDPDFHSSVQQVQEKRYEIGFVGHKGAGNGDRSKVLDILSSQFKLNDLNRWYSPEDIGVVYNQSHMVFNWSVNGDVNMREFEALCSGRLLLTNAIGNGLERLFTDREHLVVYRNVEELQSLVRYYLAHPEEREKIARAGRAEVLKKHTYRCRSAQILDTISCSEKISKSAAVRHWSAKQKWETYAQVFANLRQPLSAYRVAAHALGRSEVTLKLLLCVVTAGLRAINAQIPLTPNAIRSRIG